MKIINLNKIISYILFPLHIRSKDFTSYFDGDLSDSMKHHIDQHMKTCPKCTKKFQHLLYSVDLLKVSRQSRNLHVDSISDAKQAYHIEQIMKSITPQRVSRILPMTKRVRAFGGLLVGFFVVSILIYLFNPANPYKEIIHRSDSAPQQVSNSHEKDDQTSDTGSYSPVYNQPADQETAIDNNKVGDDENISSEMVMPNLSESETPILSAFYRMTGNNPQEADIFSADILYAIETSNTQFSYIGVSLIDAYLISQKHEQLQLISDRYGIPADIKIITGENSQKLIEYIDEESLAIFREYSLDNSKDYLVILIGR
jgi:hypothetical protein